MIVLRYIYAYFQEMVCMILYEASHLVLSLLSAAYKPLYCLSQCTNCRILQGNYEFDIYSCCTFCFKLVKMSVLV